MWFSYYIEFSNCPLPRFTSPLVVKSYVTLFREYKKNTVYTNHCVIKMLHRVAFDNKMVGMLYQASLFRAFQQLMADPACRVKQFDVSADIAILYYVVSVIA